MKKYFVALLALVTMGCGGGGGFTCNPDILFHGDSLAGGLVEGLNDIPTTPFGVTYEPGIGTEYIKGNIVDIVDERGNLIYDIVFVNSGRWDFDRRTPSQAFVTVQEYAQNLAQILTDYQNQGADVVFMLTFYAPGDNGSNRNDVDRYNEAAIRVCEASGVLVFDPNALNLMDEDFLDDIHLTDLGNIFLASEFTIWLAENFECIPISV